MKLITRPRLRYAVLFLRGKTVHPNKNKQIFTLLYSVAGISSFGAGADIALDNTNNSVLFTMGTFLSILGLVILVYAYELFYRANPPTTSTKRPKENT